MAMSNGQFISPAEAARRLGVSARALRLYERRGLLAPVRASNGWRTYGPDQIARIHEILALKAMGLGLASIAELLRGRAVSDLDRTLALHRKLLEARRRQLDKAIAVIDAARLRAASGGPLTTHDLIDLIKETTMAELHWGAVIKPFYDRHFEADDLQRMREASASPEAWEAAISELGRLVAAGADPASTEAADFFDRWWALSLQVTDGDAGLAAKGWAAWNEALADPEAATHLPLGPAELAFISQASRHWRRANPA